MYLFLEDNLIVPYDDIVLIIDYIHIQSKENTEFYENEIKNKKLINLATGNEKTMVFTDDKIYITSYGTQTLLNRSNEFFNIIGGRK